MALKWLRTWTGKWDLIDQDALVPGKESEAHSVLIKGQQDAPDDDGIPRDYGNVQDNLIQPDAGSGTGGQTEGDAIFGLGGSIDPKDPSTWPWWLIMAVGLGLVILAASGGRGRRR